MTKAYFQEQTRIRHVKAGLSDLIESLAMQQEELHEAYIEATPTQFATSGAVIHAWCAEALWELLRLLSRSFEIEDVRRIEEEVEYIRVRYNLASYYTWTAHADPAQDVYAN